jgi:hypothetical protein
MDLCLAPNQAVPHRKLIDPMVSTSKDFWKMLCGSAHKAEQICSPLEKPEWY